MCRIHKEGTDKTSFHEIHYITRPIVLLPVQLERSLSIQKQYMFQRNKDGKISTENIIFIITIRYYAAAKPPR